MIYLMEVTVMDRQLIEGPELLNANYISTLSTVDQVIIVVAVISVLEMMMTT